MARLTSDLRLRSAMWASRFASRVSIASACDGDGAAVASRTCGAGFAMGSAGVAGASDRCGEIVD